MRNFRLIVLLALLVIFIPKSASAKATLPLMPYPVQVEIRQDQFEIPTELSVYIRGVSEQRQSLLLQQLRSIAGKVIQAQSESGADMTITVKNLSQSLVPALGQSESYQLKVGKEAILLTADTELGALHGIQTLLQLMDRDHHHIQQVRIDDQPRFPWRGLMLDSVRHFIPLEDIKRQLRGMASAKLNVFHWHLTDDQGWRFESKAYPKLQQRASDGLYYTQAQIRDVVDYASLLGIRVVPELDVPGHASAIAVAYPELLSSPGPYTMERHWGVFEPLLDPSNPQVYVFIDKLVEELAGLFPDPYLHIGGDEIHPVQWQQSDKIQTYMQQHNLADTQQLHTYFNQQIQQILHQHNKQMMGWDEIFDPDLPKDILIQSWRGLESISQFAQQGYQGILSTGFYIDQPQPTAYHYRNDPVPKSVTPPQFNAQSRWQQWTLTMPRLKGSAVTGMITLIQNPGQAEQGYISLNRKPDRPVKALQTQVGVTRFWVDSWMGPTQFELDLTDEKAISGRIMLGNSPYPVRGQLLGSGQGLESAPKLNPPAALTTAQADNILGGEAATWAEMLTANNLDLRIWPRLYAVAERLWSPADMTSEEQMYQRLEKIGHYANKVVGLEPQKQQQAGLQRLVGEADIQPLLVLSQALEPAQYYTRHHIKFTQDRYHQQADLNQFVDFLPVESLALVKLKQAVQDLAQGNEMSLANIEQQLEVWKSNLPKARKLIKQSPPLQNLIPITDKLAITIGIGKQLIKQCYSERNLSDDDFHQLRKQLWKLTEVEQEMVVAAAIVVEQLMSVCHQQSH